jgi:hypothetical protein
MYSVHTPAFCDHFDVWMSTQILDMSNFFTHPQGNTVEVVGLSACSSGRNCEEHTTCGIVVQPDVVLRVRRVAVDTDDGRHVNALAVYWVSDGVDRCRVGFLPKHLLKHSESYEGKLLQVTEMYKNHSSLTLRSRNQRDRGVCLCALIDSVARPAKKQKIATRQMSVPKNARKNEASKDGADGNKNNNKNNNNNNNNQVAADTKKNTTIPTKNVGNDDDGDSSSSNDSEDYNVKGLHQLSAILEASTSANGIWNGSSSTDGNNNSDPDGNNYSESD